MTVVKVMSCPSAASSGDVSLSSFEYPRYSTADSRRMAGRGETVGSCGQYSSVLVTCVYANGLLHVEGDIPTELGEKEQDQQDDAILWWEEELEI